MKNKHIFKSLDGFNIIIEHKVPFSRFTALKQLKKHRINLHTKKN